MPTKPTSNANNANSKASQHPPTDTKPVMTPFFQALLMAESTPVMYRIVGDGSRRPSEGEIRKILDIEKPAQIVLDKLRSGQTEEDGSSRERLIECINRNIIETINSLYANPEEMKSFQYCRVIESIVPTDPYLTMLHDRFVITAADGPSANLSSLETLQFIHMQSLAKPGTIHPLDAQNALLIAGELKVPAPAWAVDVVRTVQESKLCDRGIDLDKEFGFSATGSGNASEVERRLREKIQDESMLNIWQLVLLEVPLKRVCFMEAGRRQKLQNWDLLDYDIAPNLGSIKKNKEARDQELHDNRDRFAEELRKQYYGWRTDIEKDTNSKESSVRRTQLLSMREEFLSLFPIE